MVRGMALLFCLLASAHAAAKKEREIYLPALRWGGNMWTEVKIRNRGETAARFEVSAFHRAAESVPVSVPAGVIEPGDTRTIKIQTGDPKADLGWAVVRAKAAEGKRSPELEVTAELDWLDGNELHSLVRTPAQPMANTVRFLLPWQYRNGLYFIANLDAKPAFVTLCFTQEMSTRRKACAETKEYELAANDMVLIQMPKESSGFLRLTVKGKSHLQIFMHRSKGDIRNYSVGSEIKSMPIE